MQRKLQRKSPLL
jgi:hypothetical protein